MSSDVADMHTPSQSEGTTMQHILRCNSKTRLAVTVCLLSYEFTHFQESKYKRVRDGWTESQKTLCWWPFSSIVGSQHTVFIVHTQKESQEIYIDDANCHFADLANQLHFVVFKIDQEVYISLNEMVITWKWGGSEDQGPVTRKIFTQESA